MYQGTEGGQNLTSMFNSVKDGQTFTSNPLTANIVMIPKPDRDHSSWTNFRLILLINIDMKIQTKIMANHSHSFLPRLITKDQVDGDRQEMLS